MLKFIILVFLFILLLAILPIIFTIFKSRRSIVYTYSVPDFMQKSSDLLDKTETIEQKKSLLDNFNDYFEDDGKIDGGDHGDIEDSGDDGGE